MLNTNYIQYDLCKAITLLRMGIENTSTDPDEMDESNVVMRIAYQILSALNKNIKATAISAAKMSGTSAASE